LAKVFAAFLATPLAPAFNKASYNSLAVENAVDYIYVHDGKDYPELPPYIMSFMLIMLKLRKN
jgi:hypothetical protein